MSVMVYQACLFAYRCIKGEPAIEEYYEMHLEAGMYNEKITEAVMQSSSIQQFLTVGRVVVVKSQSVSFFM
jgi:antiviral helicase SKI2